MSDTIKQSSNGDYENSTPLSLYFKPRHTVVVDLVDRLMRDCSLTNKAKRNAMFSLISNLIPIHRRDNEKYLAYSRDNNSYSKSDADNVNDMTTGMLAACVDALEAHGYLEGAKGFNGEYVGRLSRTRPTDKLASLLNQLGAFSTGELVDFLPPPLVLKAQKDADGKKKKIRYERTEAISELEGQVSGWNAHMGNHHVDLAIEPNEAVTHVSHATKLYRVFNDSSWGKGGRYYGHWVQRIPSELRPYVVIDGKQTVEVDYSSIHPRLMYAQCGAVIADDFDPYQSVAGATRDDLKLVFQLLINNDSRAKAKGALRKLITDGEIQSIATDDIGVVLDSLVEQNKPIENLFFTGIGKKLQFIDSEIARKVLEEFEREKLPLVPVHDSFIVCKRDEVMLKQAMQNAVREVLKEQGITDYERWLDPEVGEGWLESFSGDDVPTKQHQLDEKAKGLSLEDYLVDDGIEELLTTNVLNRQAAMERYGEWRKRKAYI